MASIDEDFVTYLKAQPAIAAKVGSRIHENYVPMKVTAAGDTQLLSPLPWIWFQQDGEIRADALADPVGTLPIGYRFALEVVAQSIRDARTIGALVVAALHLLTKATFGSRTIGTVFCEDQNDQYVERTGATRNGFHVCAYSVEVYL